MFVPATLKVVALKSNKNKEGLIPVHIQFVQNREINRISLRKWVKPEYWIEDGLTLIKESGKNSPQNAIELNMFLRN